MLEELSDMRETILITGAAGFIGYYLSKRLLEQGCNVIGVDNMNDYYDPKLKLTRLELLKNFVNFYFIKGDISEKSFVMKIFQDFQPKIVVNLAAQAGVRYSITNPDVYIKSNIVGFYHILEACRAYPVKHLVYASSSSVYGANRKVPFEETDQVDHPVSLYAATKKSNELMADNYSHLYKLPITGLRFFTVYGPLGRPDMAYYSFTSNFFKQQPITIYNNGDFEHDLYRDFTYIDDIIEGVVRVMNQPPKEPELHIVYNIGNHKPEKLMNFIETLEDCLGKALKRKVQFDKNFEPMKPGDVPATYASTAMLWKAVGFAPKTSIREGLQSFADWYVNYHHIAVD